MSSPEPEVDAGIGIDWGTEAAHQLLTSVRELCGVPPAIPELSDDTVAQALHEARVTLAEVGELALEDDLDSDEAEQDPQDSNSWIQAAIEYQATRGTRRSIVEIEPEELQRLRALLAAETSFQRAYNEITTRHIKGRAADSTLEVLAFSLRERGVQALEEPDTRRRLRELSDTQLLEVATRLQRLKPEIARAWSGDEVEALIQLRETLR
jgi:hypothetical protein